MGAVVAIGKRSSEPCPRCSTGRKVKLQGMGWVCSRCLEACRQVIAGSEDLDLIGDPAVRRQVAGELTLDLYRKVERNSRRCVSCGDIAGANAENFGDGLMCSRCTSVLIEELAALLGKEEAGVESSGLKRTIAR